MVRAMLPGGSPSPTGLAGVIETILDKEPIIDACILVSLIGIETLTIDARIVLASMDTYLRFAEKINRLNIAQERQGLPSLGDSSQLSSARRKTKRVLQGVGDKLREFAEPEGRPGSGRLRSREGY